MPGYKRHLRTIGEAPQTTLEAWFEFFGESLETAARAVTVVSAGTIVDRLIQLQRILESEKRSLSTLKHEHVALLIAASRERTCKAMKQVYPDVESSDVG